MRKIRKLVTLSAATAEAVERYRNSGAGGAPRLGAATTGVPSVSEALRQLVEAGLAYRVSQRN